MTSGEPETAWPPLRTPEDFPPLYDRDDGRAYFRALDRLHYRLPGVLSGLVLRRARHRARPVRVVDLGCGFGINGALLKYRGGLAAFYRRYRSDQVPAMTAAAWLASERAHFAARLRHRPRFQVAGIDVAARALVPTIMDRCTI